jgi:predicted transcriptional regulator
MDAGAWETENALKELETTKDQVATLKEWTAEVRRGKCFVHRCGVARGAATE